MSDDLKAMNNEELVREHASVSAQEPWTYRDRDRLSESEITLQRQLHATEAELLRRLEAGEQAEAELKLAETTRESWRKEAEALEQEVEGLRAEREWDEMREHLESSRAAMAAGAAMAESRALIDAARNQQTEREGAEGGE